VLVSVESSRLWKVLVVDDNVYNREVAEAHLVAAGYSVELAEDGQRGIARFLEWRPDLILLDVLMPGLDGFETCRRLKALPGGQGIPVVFLTALGDFASHQRAIESGADDFLTKPINRAELLIRVKSLLWVKRLRDELSQGYDIIRSQRDALVRSQQQKEELSALLVHDLKTPLAALIANVQFVERQDYIRSEEREALQDVLTSSEAIRRMIMNLLDISRSESGQLVPQIRDVDLSSMITQLCELMKRRAGQENVRLDCDLQAGVVRGDGDLLERLLENLLDNCIRYSRPGGRIGIRTRATGDGFLELRVSDEGPGIPAELRERIFEKYVQIEPDVMTARTSRGLGLAFCRLAAEVHGGKIWVESNQPRGTVFCVRLPLPAEASAPAA
jgi:signal transduction histidine kinase